MAIATAEPRRPEDCATAWFAVLEQSLNDGDVHRAAKATRELERLGVTVRFRRRREARHDG
jgi:hypothetical protein